MIPAIMPKKRKLGTLIRMFDAIQAVVHIRHTKGHELRRIVQMLLCSWAQRTRGHNSIDMWLDCQREVFRNPRKWIRSGLTNLSSNHLKVVVMFAINDGNETEGTCITTNRYYSPGYAGVRSLGCPSHQDPYGILPLCTFQ